MKLKVVVAGVVMALVFYCAAAFAAGVTKGSVGVINIQKILVESKSGKEAKAVFEKELEAKRVMFNAKEQGARTIENDLKSNGAKMDADARKAKESKLAEEIKGLRQMEQDIKEELKKKDGELTSGILKEVLEITKKVGAEREYSMVLQTSQQIVYLDNSIDITDEVLKRYDSRK
ncbi:MAG: OmpH family outer membrane protein [Candidatus Omnitrophica bacterium]|nr:OmpH family outer membrane protein [Candidatus Omnitrophota bacterium]